MVFELERPMSVYRDLSTSLIITEKDMPTPSLRIVLSLFILILATATFGLAGCSYDSTLSDITCEGDDDCPGDAVCENSYCVPGGSPTLDAGDAGDDADTAVPDPDTSTPDADVECIAESDLEFCQRFSDRVECGVLVEDDECGDERTVDCEQESDAFGCLPLEECVEAEVDGDVHLSCECTVSSTQDVCESGLYECGTVDSDLICSGWTGDDPVACPDCPDGEACGEDIDNICGCPCDVGGTCFNEGASPDDNECLICDPAQSETSFTHVNAGESCASTTPGADGVCDGDGACVDCIGNEHCDSNACLTCDGNQCVTYCGNDDVCDGGGNCVECTGNEHCDSNACLTCDGNDCVSACSGDDVCDGGGNCVECTGNEHCDADACLTCDGNDCVSACSGDDVCDGSGNCVECTGNEHCDADDCLICDGNDCVSACSDGDVCDGDGECVQCNVNEDCDTGDCLECSDNQCVSTCGENEYCMDSQCTCDTSHDSIECCDVGDCSSNPPQTCQNNSCSGPGG